MPKSLSTANLQLSENAINALTKQLKLVRKADFGLLKNRLNGISKIKNPQKQAEVIQKIEADILQSIALKQQKLHQLPKVEYPQQLPVSQHVDKLKNLIAKHQVVIIAGETGSGKTTQIPKICLQLGRGIEGIIGHTQPRRIAARSVANRIADELNTQLGDAVGFKVRFSDQVSPQSYIKLMTDGILLAEMQKDRLLRQYDTLIIDEAHERSLNIDFLLGYIKRILPKRPDLKVIITSATIDPQRFAKHFNDAPVVEVSGRTYPVDIWYQPLEDNADNDMIQGIINAVESLNEQPLGDILVFLNGEREIRDTAYALEKVKFKHTQILPLFSRLSVAEQNKIFAPHTGRNIVLATNVAETSLTVPGIRYVIDTGTARISRYSYRTKVQRLPIEPISQASANQRAGRCGRVAEGICIRLYDEQDFLSREAFTPPEILRTNLATVILQMLALDLGDIKDFPFVEPPDDKHIKDGMRLLEELDAIRFKGNKAKLTETGRKLAKFPVDPRLAKMVLTSLELNCVHDVMAIVAALSIQDVRERPIEKQQQADQCHARFKHQNSDFIAYLNLWHYILEQQKQCSNNQFRKLCQREFLSYIRIREWQDIYTQLKQSVQEIGKEQGHLRYHQIAEAQRQQHQDHIHQALLSGLLSHIGNLDEKREYKGARNAKFVIFPGSGLAKKTPKWIMAAELVETSRLFARQVAQIEPQWIEPFAQHLVKKHYLEPHWVKKQGSVIAYEQVSLYGLVIIQKRPVQFKNIDPKQARDLFIEQGLVTGDVFLNEAFLKHNQALIADIEQLEHKARRKNFLVDEQQMAEFYQQKLPENVVCLASFKAWWKKRKQQQPDYLNFTKADLLNEIDETVNNQNYPQTWQQSGLTLPLSYQFAPGEADDGVSVTIPLAVLNQVDDYGFDYMVPALQLELITAYIKGLPKQLRKNFVPAPNYAKACFDALPIEGLSLTQAMSKQLLKMTAVRVTEEDWQQVSIPQHLKMNFKIVDDNGKLLKQGRDLHQLQQQLKNQVKASLKQLADSDIEQQGITDWTFGDLPTEFEKHHGHIKVKAYVALVDQQSSVAIELLENEQQAQQQTLAGITRLCLLTIPSPIKYLQKHLPNQAKLALYFNPFGQIHDLLNDCIFAAAKYLVQQQELPKNKAEFQQLRDNVRGEICDQVLNSAILLEQVLTLAHQINKQLKGNTPLNVIQHYADIKNQLSQLVFKGFVSHFGADKLKDLIRYLKAIEKRIEKLKIDAHQDRLKMLELEKITSQVESFVQKQQKSPDIEHHQQHLFIMLQELRVSLFAQNIGTAMPISTKRIEQYMSQW